MAVSALGTCPPLYILPTLLIGIPVLLCLIQGARGPVMAARRGWWFGFGLHLVGLYWITEAILIEAARFWWLVPFAVPALSAVLAVFIAVPAAVTWWARPGWRAAFTLAGAWVLADLARQFVATGFPWNLLGSVWEFPGRLGDIMIQPASLIGAHGLTLPRCCWRHLPLLGWAWRVGGLALLCCVVRFRPDPDRRSQCRRPRPDGAADPGQRRTGPEMGSLLDGLDLPSLSGHDQAGGRRGRRSSGGRRLAGDRQPGACCKPTRRRAS